MDMNKTNSSIDENEESLVGEVLSDDEVREKKQAIAKWQHSPVGFGSYITKSNDLIQRTKYSLPRNEQKVLFMLMSKIDQKNDKDASKYYSITFNDFAKLTGVRTVAFRSLSRPSSPPRAKASTVCPCLLSLTSYIRTG